jgi:hypothetical protein
MQHEVLAAALQITLGGLFHSSKIDIFPILRILRNGFYVIFLKKAEKKQGGLVSRLAKPFLALD